MSKVRVGAAALVATIALTGCGGSGISAPDTGTAAEGTGSTETAAPTTSLTAESATTAAVLDPSEFSDFKEPFIEVVLTDGAGILDQAAAECLWDVLEGELTDEQKQYIVENPEMLDASDDDPRFDGFYDDRQFEIMEGRSIACLFGRE